MKYYGYSFLYIIWNCGHTLQAILWFKSLALFTWVNEFDPPPPSHLVPACLPCSLNIADGMTLKNMSDHQTPLLKTFHKSKSSQALYKLVSYYFLDLYIFQSPQWSPCCSFNPCTHYFFGHLLLPTSQVSVRLASQPSSYPCSNVTFSLRSLNYPI